MKLEKNTSQKDTQRNKLFTNIPKDKTTETIPTMRAVVIADIEDMEEVESLTTYRP